MNSQTNKAQCQGTVLAVQANFYRVQIEKNSLPHANDVGSRDLLCTRRARLKKLGQQVLVGDRVLIEEPDWSGQRGAIGAVLPRRHELQRPPIANTDQALLVFSMADPVIDCYQLSRFLVAIERQQLRVILCLSKADLVPKREQQAWCDRLTRWGYRPLLLSIYSDLGITPLQTCLQDQITVVAGPSGVGKSSLINALIPEAALRVGDISDRWRRGKHTTRHVELFELPEGGLLADTPGFTQPLIDCAPEQMIHYFPEMRDRLLQASCQFKNCLHRDEPGCVVQETSWERYPDYLSFLEEAIAYQTQCQQTRNPESRLKAKSNRRGNTQYEPKLDSKRYRRTSRKTQQQNLEQLIDDLQEPLSHSK